MSQGLHEPTPSKVANLLTIVSGAMCAGVLMFGVIAFALTMEQKPSDASIVSLLSVGMMAMSVVVSAVLPSILLPTLLRNIQLHPTAMPTQDAMLRAYFTTHIIKLALLEAPAFLALVAYMVEHHNWVLGIAAASVALLLFQIPSTTTIEDWLKHQQETLEFEQNN